MIPCFFYDIFQLNIDVLLLDLKASPCFHYGCINPSFQSLPLSDF